MTDNEFCSTINLTNRSQFILKRNLYGRHILINNYRTEFSFYTLISENLERFRNEINFTNILEVDTSE